MESDRYEPGLPVHHPQYGTGTVGEVDEDCEGPIFVVFDNGTIEPNWFTHAELMGESS